MSLFIQGPLLAPLLVGTLSTGHHQFTTLRPAEQQYRGVIERMRELGAASGALVAVGDLIQAGQDLRAALVAMEIPRPRLALLDAVLHSLQEEQARDSDAETPLASFLLSLRSAGFYPDEAEEVRAAALRLRHLASGITIPPTRIMISPLHAARRGWKHGLGELLLRWGSRLRSRVIPEARPETIRTIDEGALETFSVADPSLTSRTDTETGRSPT